MIDQPPHSWLLLSHYLDVETPAYGGRKDAFCILKKKSVECEGSELYCIQIDNHHGTHIDLPAHFCSKGKRIENYTAENWIFTRPFLLEAPVDKIESQFEKIPALTDLILFKTGFQSFRGTDQYWKDQPVIRAEWAEALKKQAPGLKAVGFDLISLSSQRDREEGKKAHKEFLCKNDLMIIEDMNLLPLKNQPKQVIVAPLLVKELDGAPCTVLTYV